jgi:protein SCO1/2
MRILFFSGAAALLLLLAGCSKPAPSPQSHLTDISGSMPRLDFRLTRASDGKIVTGNDYLYTSVVMYFGYTQCPDVCPTTLANLTDMQERAKKLGLKILFVTVDPDRDTLPVLKKYSAAFSSQVDGLRGTPNQIADLARRYRVAYSVKKGPPYEVMHSNAVFFFDQEGKARFVTTDTNDSVAMADDVKRLLN